MIIVSSRLDMSQSCHFELVSSVAGLQIMMLKPDTPESKLLVDWVEGGELLILYTCCCHLECTWLVQLDWSLQHLRWSLQVSMMP